MPIIPTCKFTWKYFATYFLIGQFLWASSNNWICSIVTWLHEMDENLLLLSSTDGGDDYLLFTANELKEKQIFFANINISSKWICFRHDIVAHIALSNNHHSCKENADHNKYQVIILLVMFEGKLRESYRTWIVISKVLSSPLWLDWNSVTDNHGYVSLVVATTPFGM